MQEKKSTKTYDELPETITPYDYADWRGIGENKAREIFNRKDFPRIKVGTGSKQEIPNLINYVIDKVNNEEYERLEKGVELAAEAVKLCLKIGIDNAMNTLN